MRFFSSHNPFAISRSGYPIIPVITSEYAEGEEIVWYREDGEGTDTYSKLIKFDDLSLIGCKLKVFCTPFTYKSNNEKVYGRSVTFYVHGKIEASPQSRMVSIREEYNKRITETGHLNLCLEKKDEKKDNMGEIEVLTQSSCFRTNCSVIVIKLYLLFRKRC